MPDSQIDLLDEILKTHIVAFQETNNLKTVRFLSRSSKIDISVTMPTLEEALTIALETWQDMRRLPIELSDASGVEPVMSAERIAGRCMRSEACRCGSRILQTSI